MRRILLLLVSLVPLAGGVAGLYSCSGGGGGGNGNGGGSGGSGGVGGGLAQFGVTVLDPNARESTFIAMAVEPVSERVGVAYFTPRGTFSDGGIADYNLNYLEYKQGVVSGQETLGYVQVLEGLSLAFDPTNGNPVVAYLGGSPGGGSSLMWLQSDAVYRMKSGGTWGPEVVVAANSGDVPCDAALYGDQCVNNNVSSNGFLVGLWPALVFDSSGKMYFAYRDNLNGQNTVDWTGSDVELWSGIPSAGPPSTLLSKYMLVAGGKNKYSYGMHIQFVMAGTQPAVAYDQQSGEGPNPYSPSHNVYFQQRLGSGAWTTPKSIIGAATGAGPSMAYDSEIGYGVAVSDGRQSLTYYETRDPQTATTWGNDPFFGSRGYAGWYPSLAMDPINHEPSIAYYVCASTEKTATECPDTQNELVVTQRNKDSGQWRSVQVDPEGGYAPKLGFFASGKRFVVYRKPPAKDQTTGNSVANVGELRIAVER